MLAFLKNHPFAVEAFFESSIVLTFAVPKEQLQGFLPPCLTLDSFDNNKWGFIVVAMVKTKELRPKGFPAFLGHEFFLVGYRIFVRYHSVSGKSLRGLYILKSETDNKMMEFLGNIFTRYQYMTTDIHETRENNVRSIRSVRSGFDILIDRTEGENVPLPESSPFADWKQARRFAGPLPFTFSYNTEDKKVLIIEGVRENWTPTPLKVIKYNFSFLNSLNLKEARLANAFIIKDVPYRWKKGRTEPWQR